MCYVFSISGDSRCVQGGMTVKETYFGQQQRWFNQLIDNDVANTS